MLVVFARIGWSVFYYRLLGVSAQQYHAVLMHLVVVEELWTVVVVVIVVPQLPKKMHEVVT